MDARDDSADDLTRFAMNSNSPPTLVELSEAPNNEVDVIEPPSALEQMLQPMLSPPVAEKDSATDDYLEQISNDNDIWSVIGGERTQELCTPKGKRPELTSDAHSQHTREPSLGSIFGETSRQLPPLPASPDPIPTSTQGATLHNPFLDLEPPTLPPILPGPSYGSDLNIYSNTGPSRWQLQAAAQPDSSLQARMNPVPRATWTNSNRISSDSRDDTYDSQWAKHMEERSQRIQTQQRTERESGLSTPWNGRPTLGPRPNPNTPSSPSRTPPTRTGSSRRFPPASPSREPEPNLEPWRRRIQDQRYSHPNQRPDIQSRNAALDTISNILFNFDCPTEEAAVLLEDVCATANEVGVSTVELLAQTVTIGNFDLGMTALCLEASRCDLGGSLDVLTWLLENVAPGSIERDLRTGCLMRNNGMGDHVAWSTMKLFVPEQENNAIFAYDATVENIFHVPGATINQESKKAEPGPEPAVDSDDDGSLYDDVSLIDAESIDQADIETLKSSDDEGDANTKNDTATTAPATGPSSKVHRARINIPYFESSLRLEDEHIIPAYTALPPWSPTTPSKLQKEKGPGSNTSGPTPHMPMKNRVLTAEWMHEGRVWALAMGENKLALTLRHTSEVVPRGPIKVKAFIRIFPEDIEWNEVEELASTGSDRLLPTYSSVVGPAITPSYSCEFDEVPLIPGPAALNGNTSLWKDDIQMSRLSLLDLVGMSGAMKVEVVIKTSEIPPTGTPVVEECPSAGPNQRSCEIEKPKAPESVSGESDAEWQQIDP